MNTDSKSGQHRIAVVTGTAQGIGAAIAAGLKADGITVHGIDKDTVDVTDSAAVNAFFAEIGDRFAGGFQQGFNAGAADFGIFAG